VDASTTGGGINGGVGGGEGYEGRVLFYVGVPNVEAALRKAESLGGQRRMGPEGTPGTLVVGRFTDPEGNLIGVAGIEQPAIPPSPLWLTESSKRGNGIDLSPPRAQRIGCHVNVGDQQLRRDRTSPRPTRQISVHLGF
jgi:hypothetical protein